MKTFKQFLVESYNDFYDEITTIGDNLQNEILNAKHGDKVKWQVVPAGRLTKIWKDYAKLGVIRDEKGLQDIKNLLIHNIAKFYWCSALNGTERNYPHTEWLENGEITQEQFNHIEDMLFNDYFLFYNNNSIQSDYGVKPLMSLAKELSVAKRDVDILTIIDKILNVTHQSNDLPSFFIEGGTKTLDKLSESMVKK